MGNGNTLVAFKINQQALLSNECLSIFSSWLNWREKQALFLEEASVDLSSKLSVTYGAHVNHYKSVHHSLFTLLVRIRYTWQVSKQISKLFSKSVSRYILFLAKLKGRWRSFFGECKKGGRFVRLPPKALGCYKR